MDSGQQQCLAYTLVEKTLTVSFMISQNGGTNCPACRGPSTSVNPSRHIQAMVDVLLRAAPHKHRTMRERQQADEIYPSLKTFRVSFTFLTCLLYFVGSACSGIGLAGGDELGITQPLLRWSLRNRGKADVYLFMFYLHFRGFCANS